MKILIIEDEIPAQRMLLEMLNKINYDIKVIGLLDSVNSSVEWFENNQHPEIVLMDIQLSDGISFDIIKQVHIESLIIFITAFDEYAIQAFKANSIDYLLKPIELNDLESAFKKYEDYSKRFIKLRNKELNFEEILNSIVNSQPNYRKQFLIRTNEEFFKLPIDDIAYFYSTNKITFAVTFKKREHVIDLSLEKLREQLNSNDFFKINRQIIVSMKSIKKVHVFFHGKLVIETMPEYHEKIIVGKDKAAAFKRWLDK